MGSVYIWIPFGLGLRESRTESSGERRRQGVVYSSSAEGGGVGNPPGGFAQNSSEVEVEFVSDVRGSWTLADQKEVSFIDFPEGRSSINRPSSLAVQKPPTTALEVHTYVFCYAALLSTR